MDQAISLPKKSARARQARKNIFLRISIWILAPSLILYFTVGTIAAEKLTLPTRVFDETYTPASSNLAYENIIFLSKDGEANISAWYIPSADNTRAVIIVHGRNASRTELFLHRSVDLAAALHQAGFSVLMIDLRGHGQSSSGRFTFGQKERYDVMGGVSWLMQHGYTAGKIGVMGISLGSSAAIGAAADDPRIGALVSDSGFAEIYPLIQSRWSQESGLPQFFLPITRLMIQWKFSYDITASKPAAEIGRVVPRPILLIHCVDDEVIPYANVQQLAAAAPTAQLWSIPSCTHGQSFNATTIEYEQRLVKFFDTGLR